MSATKNLILYLFHFDDVALSAGLSGVPNIKVKC